MDYCEQCILSTLRDGEPYSFAEIQSQVSFSHDTLQQHLKQLADKGLVLKEKDPSRGFGRPKYVYRGPP